MTLPRILIAHPGATSLLYPLVGIVGGLDVDLAFHTSVFFVPGGPLDRMLSILPARLRDRVRRQMSRRSHPDVNPALVHQHPLGEILHLAAQGFGSPEKTRRALYARNERFDSAIAALIAKSPPDIYIGFDGSAEHSLEACRSARVPSVLFQAIGHIDYGYRILAQEKKLHAAFAAVDIDLDSREWHRRNAAEALLADHVVVPSDYVRDTLIAEARDERGIHLIPYPIDTKRFHPSAAPRTDRGLRLLFAGQIGMRKGVIYALQALQRLGRDDIKLTLVGALPDGTSWLEPYRGLYEHIASVPYAEMPALFQAADAFVFPSLHEGSAMAINEALASGLPAIVTPNSGSIVRDGVDGFLVPLRDVDAIASRIAHLADDPALRLKMAQSARARAEAHDFAAYRSAFATLIDRILSGHFGSV